MIAVKIYKFEELSCDLQEALITTEKNRHEPACIMTREECRKFLVNRGRVFIFHSQLIENYEMSFEIIPLPWRLMT
jgi:hypothetical protein